MSQVRATIRGCGIASMIVVVVGCATLTTGVDPYTIHVRNGTALPVEVIVNRQPLARVDPRASLDILGDAVGPRPWAIEVATAETGRDLLSFEVADGDVDIEGNDQRGDGARADLSCGRLDVYVGPPMLGPAPGPGLPGDCLP